MSEAESQLSAIDRAWRYYQHADAIQHQRHGVFMVAHAMLFAAFAQRVADASAIYAALGILFSGIWYVQAQRLSDGMAALSAKYLAASGTEGDPVYVHYLSGLAKLGGPSGRTLMNVIIPGATGLAWVVLASFSLWSKSLLVASGT